MFVGWMRLLWVGMLGFDFGGFGFGVWCLGGLLICLRISGVWVLMVCEFCRFGGLWI